MAHSRLKDPESVYYLDAFNKIVGKFLSDKIIPVIARKKDAIDIRKKWASNVSFAIVSGILIKLAKRYPDDVNEFWDQAKISAKNFAMEDLAKHPSDYLMSRLERWIEQFKELQKYPIIKKSSQTGKERPHELVCLFEFKETCIKLEKIYDKSKKAKDYVKELTNLFPDLLDDDIQTFALELKAGISISEIGMLITAKYFNMNEDTFKRHYLAGSKKLAKRFDEALRYR
jgi:hypothetical protein